MTDNEIIKAFEICMCSLHCFGCPYYDLDGDVVCYRKLCSDITNIINRKQAEIEGLQELLDSAVSSERNAVEALKISTVHVAEVKHGEWEKQNSDFLYKCSICGDYAFLKLGGKPCNYCPNCGAKMDGKENDHE